jgi:uncharacterized membrane protein
MNRTAMTRRRGMLKAAVCGALSAVFALSIGTPLADVDKKYDWKNKKRHLKVCLESSAGCPAGMEDSLKAAISEWNKKLVSWKLAFDSTCTSADVKVKCGKIKGLGLWQSTSGSYGASTGNTITVDKDAPWGWCNDKNELVDVLVHELGHAMRLNDINSPGKSMHRSRGKSGHQRSPTAADSTEAATSDSTTVVQADTDPPGGKKVGLYSGVVTPNESAPLFNLSTALAMDIVTYRPWAVNTIGAFPIGENAIQWDADILADADHSEAFWVIITYPDTVLYWDGILKVAPDWWDPSLEPEAIAPPDTTVQEGELIVLYNTLSVHPMGPDWMSFRWEIDGTSVLKGYDTTSVVLPVGAHSIVLWAEDELGRESSDTMGVMVDVGSGVEEGPHGLNRLDFNYPNPFNPSTTIRFEVAERGRVTLRIYNVSGQLVRTLLDDVVEPGVEHLTNWNGRDDRGRAVASGVYFVRLDAAGFAETRKMVLLR